ncbi:MAG: glutaredoxin family protein [Nitriliruptorales bacterium]|nr:glutaredoxin family protein [Nitriliruptorales bacterium]
MALTIGRGRRGYRSLVEVYTRDNCGLCAKAEELVDDEAGRADVRLIDIDENDELVKRYGVRVPVIVVDGREVAEGQVEPGEIRRALRRARRGRWAEWRRA